MIIKAKKNRFRLVTRNNSTLFFNLCFKYRGCRTHPDVSYAPLLSALFSVFIRKFRMNSKYPPVKPGALWVNRSKRLAQTLGRLKAAGYLSRFN
jgi:hypothetical protein